MTDHKVIGREEWQAARDELLHREKEHTRMADELGASAASCPGSRSRRSTGSTPTTGHGPWPGSSTAAHSC